MKKDTILHFAVSGILVCIFAIPYMLYGDQALLWLAGYLTMTVGVLKEYIDWVEYGKKLGLKKFLPMAIKDLAADIVGIAAGIVLLAVIYG